MAVVKTIFTAKSTTFADNLANGASENDGYNYIAYQEGTTGIARNLYVEKLNGPRDKRVVYCFNKSLQWPTNKGEIGNLLYRKKNKDYKIPEITNDLAANSTLDLYLSNDVKNNK